MKDVNVGIVTCVGATIRDDGPRLQVWLTGKNKVTFDIATEKDTFFDTKDVIGRNLGKLPIIDMPSTFNPSIEAGPSWQYSILCKFFESFLSLARDSDALVELETLLHHPKKTVKDSAMNYLQKRKTSKEMRMNIQIEDYEVISVILYPRLDVNILTKKTW